MSKSRLSALAGYRAGFLPNPTLAMLSVYTSAFAQSRDLKSSGATGGERKRTQATSGGERRKNVTQGLKALERGREIGSGKAL